jgi:hypothetical protein
MREYLKINRIGGGLFAHVFGVEDPSEQVKFDVVLKRTSNGDPWMRFAKWVISVRDKKVPGKQFLPEIYHVSSSADANAAVAMIKKYNYTLNELLRRNTAGKFDAKKQEARKKFMERYFGCEDTNSNCDQAIESFMRFHGAGRGSQWKDCFSITAFRGMKPKKEIKDFIFFLRWLASKKENIGFFPNDVHTGNIMLDDNMNLVLTDPTS